jgi:hypothetical protein
MRLYNPFINVPVALHFSLQTSHSYRLVPTSSSIRLYLGISHVDMQRSNLLLMVVRSMGILHNSNPRIRTKNYFHVPLILQEMCM